jgi:hypothetical protein
MAGHRPGQPRLALGTLAKKDVDARDERGHDRVEVFVSGRKLDAVRDRRVGIEAIDERHAGR